jgi:phage terminase small subunit
MAKNCKKLTDNQKKFAEEYLIHGNRSLAYRTAYPNAKKSFGVSGHHLLKNPKVSAYIEKRKAAMAAKLEITPEKTLRAYARRAYFDPRQLFDPETGDIIPLHRLPRDVAAGVTKIKVKRLKTRMEDGEEGPVIIEPEIIEITWDTGDSSRDAISKYQGLFEKDNAQRGQVDQEARQEFMKDLFQTISQANGRGLPEPRE